MKQAIDFVGSSFEAQLLAFPFPEEEKIKEGEKKGGGKEGFELNQVNASRHRRILTIPGDRLRP